jgi:catechol 2,3-dioxygenase-like lactoylglutathione lyase family enzyme
MILKRTTIFVEDAARMLRFYRDVLRWNVHDDAEITITGAGGLPGTHIGDRVRLVIMGSVDPEIGKVGLLEYRQSALPRPPLKHQVGAGDIVLVADVNDITVLAARLKAEPDVRIVHEPMDWTFPSPDGMGDIELTSMSFFDPSCVLHEVYYRHNRPNPLGYLMRRTTAIVDDNPATVAFYRDVLGLTVYEDNTIRSTGMALPTAAGAGAQMRMTVCRAKHPYIGMVGALQFLDPPLPPMQIFPPLRIGQVLMIAGSSDPEALFARVKASGAEILQNLYTSEVPNNRGVGATLRKSMGFRDPAGLIWEVNQRT